MRKSPNEDELLGMVLGALNNAIDDGIPFSIHTLTQKARVAHPSYEISHRVVRKVVYPTIKVMADHGVLIVEDKGEYNEYTPLTYS